METNELGQRLTSLRKNSNMTQKELADRLHVSNKVISKWELGQSEPSIQMLKEIASVYNISVSQLLNENSAKEDLNEVAFNFFKKNYLLLLQIIFNLSLLIFFTISYSILLHDKYDIVENYECAIMLGFSIAMSLLQLVFIFIKCDNKILLAFKIFLAIVALITALLSIFSIVCVQVDLSFTYNLLTGIGFLLMALSIFFNILSDWSNLSYNTFKLGKITFIVVAILLSLQTGFMGTTLAFTATPLQYQQYLDASPREIYFYPSSSINLELGQTQRLIPFFDEYEIQEKIFLESISYPKIQYENGYVIATRPGYHYLRFKCNVRRKRNQSYTIFSTCMVHVNENFVLSHTPSKKLSDNQYSTTFQLVDSAKNVDVTKFTKIDFSGVILNSMVQNGNELTIIWYKPYYSSVNSVEIRVQFEGPSMDTTVYSFIEEI